MEAREVLEGLRSNASLVEETVDRGRNSASARVKAGPRVDARGILERATDGRSQSTFDFRGRKIGLVPLVIDGLYVGLSVGFQRNADSQDREGLAVIIVEVGVLGHARKALGKKRVKWPRPKR